MGISRIKCSITYLFLALFVSMQVAGLHVLTHIDENDGIVHCTLCDYTIVNNQTPLLPPDTQEFNLEQVVFVIKKEATGEFHFVYCDTALPNHLFSRPPPVYL